MKCWNVKSHAYVTGVNVTCNRCVYCGEHKVITRIKSLCLKGK